jgi:hypothetical protein
MNKISVFLSYVLALTTTAASAASIADTKATHAFQSLRKAGQTDKVVVLMEVAGEFKEHDATTQGKDRRTAMSGQCRLTYHEKTLEAPAGGRRAVRYYENAESDVRFKDGGHRPSLAAERRLVGVAVDAQSATLFSLGEPLTRDELEVIDILGNTLLLDDLLPQKPVAIGEAWKPADKTVAALLGLAGATRSDVQCVLKEVTDAVARFDLAGSVEGPVADTTARITLKGRYRFDLRTKRIDWFALVTKEDRGISQVAAGFDVGVRLQMTILPEAAPRQLAGATIGDPDVGPTSPEGRLMFQSPHDRWQIAYDHRWYLNSDDRENALLKRIDQGVLTGQCNIASLVQRDPDKLVTLDEFQANVRRALGENFDQFVEAKQSVDKSDHRVLRVVVQGQVGKKTTIVPIRWIYYHVADRQGRQVALTFTIEQERVEQFGDADKEIVQSLRFAKPALKEESRARTVKTKEG